MCAARQGGERVLFDEVLAEPGFTRDDLLI